MDKGNTETQKSSEPEHLQEEMEKETRDFGSSPIYAGPKRSAKKIPFVVGILLLILILFGLFYILRARPKNSQSPPPPVGFVKEPTPEPSPTPSFERAAYTLRVLNGTKLSGLAASTSAKLKDLGYKVERVGNATNSAFLKTVVRAKPDLKELLESLLKDLSALNFKGEEGPALADDDNTSAEVILGKDKTL